MLILMFPLMGIFLFKHNAIHEYLYEEFLCNNL